MKLGEAVERAGLREERALGAQRRRPAVLVPAALHAPDDVDRPRLHAVGGETQRLERDRDLDLVAFVGDASLRVVDVVGRQVGDLASALQPAEQGAAAVVAALDQRAVCLNAQRVDAEDQRLASVVERIQENLNRIVGVDAVAVGERGMDRAGGGVRLDSEVDRGRRVEDEDFGRVLGGAAVDRRVLREVGEPHRLLPHRFVEDAVDGDHRRRVEARQRHMYLIVAPAVDGDREREDQRCEHGVLKRNTISLDAVR